MCVCRRDGLRVQEKGCGVRVMHKGEGVKARAWVSGWIFGMVGHKGEGVKVRIWVSGGFLVWLVTRGRG